MMLNMEFMIVTPGKLFLSIYGQLGCVSIEQELKAEGSFISVAVSGNANGRDRNKEMYGGVLTALESESGQRFFKKKQKKKPKSLC